MNHKASSSRSHPDRLIPARPDDMALNIEVTKRIMQLCGDYIRIKGEELKFPPQLIPAVELFKAFQTRILTNDPRCKVSEVIATREVADWTLAINAAIRNQDLPTVDYGDLPKP